MVSVLDLKLELDINTDVGDLVGSPGRESETKKLAFFIVPSERRSSLSSLFKDSTSGESKLRLVDMFSICSFAPFRSSSTKKVFSNTTKEYVTAEKTRTDF